MYNNNTFIKISVSIVPKYKNWIMRVLIHISKHLVDLNCEWESAFGLSKKKDTSDEPGIYPTSSLGIVLWSKT